MDTGRAESRGQRLCDLKIKGGNYVLTAIAQDVGGGMRGSVEWPGRAGVIAGGVVAYHVSLLGSAFSMLILALAAMALDFLAGVVFAVKRRDFSSQALYEGAWGKVGRGLLIPVGLLIDGLVVVGSGLFPGDGALGETMGEVLPWTMLACAWLVVGEAGSTLSLIAEHAGEGAVPGRFKSFLAKLTSWLSGQQKRPPEEQG